MGVLTWCSFRDMRMPGTTTFLSSSMSAKIHSSRTEEMRKSPLNKAWSPYRKDSRLLRGRDGEEEGKKRKGAALTPVRTGGGGGGGGTHLDI